MERDASPLPVSGIEAVAAEMERRRIRAEGARVVPLGRTRGSLRRLRSEQTSRIQISPRQLLNWDNQRLEEYADELSSQRPLNEREIKELQDMHRRVTNRISSRASRERKKLVSFHLATENVELKEKLRKANVRISVQELDLADLRALLASLGVEPPSPRPIETPIQSSSEEEANEEDEPVF